MIANVERCLLVGRVDWAVTTPIASFQGVLQAADVKKHLVFPFDVPVGAAGLELILSFEPAWAGSIRNMLCLGLLGPEGFRGSGHRHGTEHRVVLDKTSVTPGYFPGPLTAGTWHALVHTHMIMPGEDVQYRLEVNLTRNHTDATDTKPQALFEPTPPKPALPKRGTGWYRGDLHAHSTHSDASWTVQGLFANARRQGLDFVTLSDHNTVSGLTEMDALQTPDLLTLGGLELTTFYGHALALGRRGWLDWVGTPMRDLARQADEEGLFIIAHPFRPGDPVCTGCRWAYPELMPGTARVVEIWNGGRWDEANEAALACWYRWLNGGYRMTVSAGTDGHRPTPEGEAVGYNVVYAEMLTERAVLDAVRQGKSYLSSGPRLELTRLGSVEPITGEVIETARALSLCYAGVPQGAVLRLIFDGNIYSETALADEGRLEFTPPEGARWSVLELRDEGDRVLAVTNAVFTRLFEEVVAAS